MADQPNGQEPYMSVREMVAEIRKDLKELKADMATREQHDDHETRLRSLETWKYGIPFSGIAAIAAAVTAVLSSH